MKNHNDTSISSSEKNTSTESEKSAVKISTTPAEYKNTVSMRLGARSSAFRPKRTPK